MTCESQVTERIGEFALSASSSAPLLLLEDRISSPLGAGLANLGNTCFFNAVLQCLTHTVPLVDGLREKHHKLKCKREEVCMLCNTRDHIEQALSSTGGVVEPRNLVDFLYGASPAFQKYEQGDAQEFLQWLLDVLHTSSLDSTSVSNCLSLQGDSFIKDIFGGCLKSKIRCCKCGHCSDHFELVLNLSLEVDESDSLVDALKSFTKLESIDDPETKITCDKCKEAVNVDKQFTLEHAPPIASFHLKRFKSDGYTVDKIGKFVEYPLELDIRPYISSSEYEESPLYDLYGIVVHLGYSPWSGHYLSFIRSSPNSWHQLDDSSVLPSSEREALSQEAYMLFYKRREIPWFSSFMEGEMLVQRKNTDMGSATTSPQSFLDDSDTSRTRQPLCSTSGFNSEEDETVDNPAVMDFRLSTPSPSSISSGPDEPEERFEVVRTGDLEHQTVQPVTPAANTPPSLAEQRQAEALKRLVKNMPGSRRTNLLAHLSPWYGSFSDPVPSRKTKRAKLAASLSDTGIVTKRTSRSQSPNPSNGSSAVSYQSISPRSLDRAFADGSSSYDCALE